jgi:hypothetical protein
MGERLGAGRDQRLESIKCRAAPVQIYGGVARTKKRAGREGERMVCLVWFGVARTVAASLWPFGRSREPPLPESGLLCDD